MMKLIRPIAVFLLVLGLVGSARIAFAEGDEESATCCTSGTQCNAGQACCRRKPPAAPCSQNVEEECVDKAGDCAGASD
jgi:hypothetical protein